MKPTPQYLAVLISLIGLGVSWPEVAFSQGVAGLSSPAPSADAKEAAIRNALGIHETPSNSEGARTNSLLGAATRTGSKMDTPSPARGENVKWNRTVLGLASRGITVQVRTRAGRATEQHETMQAEQLARIRSILGLKARDDIASVYLPRQVNRASNALLHPTVAFTSAPRQQIKREVVSPSSVSTPPVPIEVPSENPQLLSSAPAPTGDMVVEAIFGQSSAPKTPKRYRDEPLPMLADGSASGLRREDRRLPLLVLVPTTPVDMAEADPESRSTDADVNSDDRANAIALATPSELTADYLDPLMPLLRALRASSNQPEPVPALTERISSAPGTASVPAVLEAANDEIADVATAAIDERASFSPNAWRATEISASDKSEAPPTPLLAKIEVPKPSIFFSDGNFLGETLSVVELAKSSEAADVQIAASESLSEGGLNSPSDDDAGQLFLATESLIPDPTREINIPRFSIAHADGPTIQIADDKIIRLADSDLNATKLRIATEIASEEVSITIPSSRTGSVSVAGISRLPLVEREEPVGARSQPIVSGTHEAIPPHEALSAQFDIFDPKMSAPPLSADTFELFTLKEALSTWFDIFDPKMVAPRVVASPVEDHRADQLHLASRSRSPDRFDGALLTVRESDALFKASTGLVLAQTLPNLQFETTAGIEARLSMLDLVEIPYLQSESDASTDPHRSAANTDKSNDQTASSVLEESTIEKAMARRSLAASTPTVSREVPHQSQESAAADEPSAVQAYSSIESGAQDVVRSVRPLEPQQPRSLDREPPPVMTAMDELRTNPLQGELISLSDSKLDQMRGGFETDAGLRISFGIERAVYINGTLVTTTSLNIADLSKFSAGQAQAAGLSGTSLGLIQNGPSNTFAPGQIAASSVATVVQNTLNDQKIQGITLINATVNSLDLIRRANVQSSIQSALTDSLRR